MLQEEIPVSAGLQCGGLKSAKKDNSRDNPQFEGLSAKHGRTGAQNRPSVAGHGRLGETAHRERQKNTLVASRIRCAETPFPGASCSTRMNSSYLHDVRFLEHPFREASSPVNLTTFSFLEHPIPKVQLLNGYRALFRNEAL